MALIFEDPSIQRQIEDVTRSPSFRKLKIEVNAEAANIGGKPDDLATAICRALKERLTDDLMEAKEPG